MNFLIRVLIIKLYFVSNVLADEISGIPKIIDGDTIHIGSNKIRLEGIDAPEMRQKCKKEYFKIKILAGYTFYTDYYCGEVSKKKLLNKIKKSKIRCKISSQDRYKRYLATCFKKRLNLNQWMVRNGYAIVYRRYSKKYLLDEAFAKENKLGLWQGKFIRPEKWRKLN